MGQPARVDFGRSQWREERPEQWSSGEQPVALEQRRVARLEQPVARREQPVAQAKQLVRQPGATAQFKGVCGLA